MTGFTKCLRKCFRTPAEDWKPLRRNVEKGDSEKVTVKVTAATGGRDQIGEALNGISCMHVLGKVFCTASEGSKCPCVISLRHVALQPELQSISLQTKYVLHGSLSHEIAYPKSMTVIKDIND